MANPSSSKNRLPSLDGLRAIAIIAVILSHSVPILAVAPRWLGFGETLREGVDLFFAISGLLITSLLVGERERCGIDLRAFYVRRAFRILPPVALYIVVLALLARFAVVQVRSWEFASSLLFSRNYMMYRHGPTTGHFWSLSVEEHFYLFWPLCVAVLAPRRLMSFAIGAVLVVGVWRAIDVRQHLFARFMPDAGVLFRTDTRIDALLCGSLAGLLLPWARHLRHIRVGGWVPWVLFAFIVLAHCVRLPMLPTFLSIAYAALVLACVVWADSAQVRWLDIRTLQAIGALSYSLYIWQTLWLQSQGISFSAGSAPDRWLAARWIMDCAAIVGCAVFSYFLVEQPIRRLGYRVAAQAHKRQVTSAAVANNVVS